MVGVRAVASGSHVALCVAALGLALGLTPGMAASQTPPSLAVSQSPPGALEVGTTVVARNQVTALLGSDQRDLKTGHRVHRDELIRTGPQAQVELKLDDETKLALGPDAELRLDDFAVDAGSDVKSIAVRLLKGTLRFLTGRQGSDSYKIVTRTATIGVRGTVFDLYISPQGETFVLMHQGTVSICSLTDSTCRCHRSIGRIIKVTTEGAVSVPGKWIEGRIRGVTVAEAFPFVGRSLEIDRMRRMTHNAITQPLKGLDQGGKAIERTLKKLSPF